MLNDKNLTTSRHRSNNDNALELRPIEKIIMTLFLLLIISILIVSGWSAALVALGYEEGGGPIGAVVSLLS